MANKDLDLTPGAEAHEASGSTTIAPGHDVSQLRPVSEAHAIVHLIERAARDPSIDIDKMKELIALQNQAEDRRDARGFSTAMSAAQSEMRAVAADSSNPQTKSRYASYFALDKALRPIYTKHGLALSFDTGEGALEQHVRVVCYVSRGGFTRAYHIDMPADGKGAKGGDVMTKTHAVGSAAAYGQRYLLKLIFNIAVGEDDDGNGAGDTSEITSEQRDHLISVISEVDADLNKFCEFYEIASVGLLPSAKYADAIKRLEEWHAKQKRAATQGGRQ